jgi:hypothetical protein
VQKYPLLFVMDCDAPIAVHPSPAPVTAIVGFPETPLPLLTEIPALAEIVRPTTVPVLASKDCNPVVLIFKLLFIIFLPLLKK